MVVSKVIVPSQSTEALSAKTEITSPERNGGISPQCRVQLWSPLSRRTGPSWNSCKEDMTGNVASLLL